MLLDNYLYWARLIQFLNATDILTVTGNAILNKTWMFATIFFGRDRLCSKLGKAYNKQTQALIRTKPKSTPGDMTGEGRGYAW
jgi:hypothetical protein